MMPMRPLNEIRIHRHSHTLILFSAAVQFLSIVCLSGGMNAHLAKTSHDLKLVPPSQAETWPRDAVENGTYVAQPGDQSLTVDHIKLPRGFTIIFPSDFTAVKWRARVLEFGEGCTIVLSPRMSESAPSVIAPPVLNDKDYGQAGNRGNDGEAGRPGRDGISFTLNVETVVPSGSLWIETSGENGGTGGTGSQGGTGGGSRCINAISPGEDGGRGGDGGNAGPGGPGGNTSAVQIKIGDSKFRSLVSPAACPTNFFDRCGFVSRPSSANGNTGAIVIWGAPGCGGFTGSPGEGGNGGDEGKRRDCGFGRKDHFGGAHGNRGKSGFILGPMGSCTILHD